jgi:acyl dehydratase
MALLARQLYFEAVKIGDELPPLVKPPVDRTQIARYAGASGDFNPLYVDEHLARNAGFPSSLAPGMLVMGFLGELIVDWLRGARLRRYTARFVKIVWPGDVITCRGRVVDRRFEGNGVYAIDLEVWAENQRGELVLKGLVTSQLFYNAEDDARQRAGQPPLVTTAEEEAARLAKLSRAQGKKQEPARPPPPPPPRPPPKAVPPARPGAPAPAARGVASRPGSVPPGTRGATPLPTRGAAPAKPVPAPKAVPTKAPSKPTRPARVAARSRPKTAPARPAGKRSAARPARSKPAARGSRPRPGTKPTGKKRR